MSTKIIAAALMAFGAVTTFADVAVVDVKVQPRSPWNGLVDIEYTIACENSQTEVYVHPVAYDGDRRMTLFMNHLSGDGVNETVKPGKHKMTWNSIADYGVFSCANFQVKICAGERIPQYVKIDLSEGSEALEYPIAFSPVGPDLTKDDCRTTELWLRMIPPGEFWMGSPTNELGRSEDENFHHVTLTKPFYLGIFEVTQKQWELVMGTNPSNYKDASDQAVRPVENFQYDHLRGTDDPATSDMSRDSFIVRLRQKTHKLCFDLPTEARWEYACRAGTLTALYTGKNLTDTRACASVDEVARYFANGWAEVPPAATDEKYGTCKVGSYKANCLGLYDMLGNVFEICRDGGGVVGGSVACPGFDDVTDPLITSYTRSSSYSTPHMVYVCKGGAYDQKAGVCRSAYRGYYYGLNGGYYSRREASKTTGFRVCAESEF